jgi:hypothetical protein
MSKIVYGFYVSFSGESVNPIKNVYALSTSGSIVTPTVLDPSRTYQELRGMAFGPDGNLYVAQAQKSASAILRFNGTLAPKSSTMTYLGQFTTPAQSSGLLHPYQPIFANGGNLYVTSQDSNVVTGFYGPQSQSPHTPGSAMPNSQFLATNFPNGTFNPGTFVAALSAKSAVPTPVPASQGGLTFAATQGGSTHSVRGIAFDGSHFYVSDEAADRVAVYDTGGAFLGAITQSISAPVALFFDAANGMLYIGSPGSGQVLTYAVANVAKRNFTPTTLISNKKLSHVSGIAVDAGGNVYTGDRKSGQIYQWLPGSHSPTSFGSSFSDSPEQIIPVYRPLTGT